MTDESFKDTLYVYVFMLDGKERYIYAHSEKEARAKYLRWWHKTPGELIRRDPW